MDCFLAEAYLHTLDPFAFEFPAAWARKPLVPDGIRWYGLSYAAGFLIAWGLLKWLASTRRSRLPAEAVGDLMFAAIVGVLIGGRLGWAIFYQHGEPLVTFSSSFPFWEVLAINRGGMASHGGMIGMIAACWIFAWRRKLSILHLFDLGAFACPPGLFLGRMANFLNAELWGRALPAGQQGSAPWWSVKYPAEIAMLPAERLAELEPAVQIVEGGTREWTDVYSRMAFDVEAEARVRALVHEVIAAAQSGNEAVGEIVRPLVHAYYPSQIIQAVAEGPVLMGVMALVWLKPRKPGVVGSVFLVTYAALRILTEAFRQPDEGVALLMGLSRGQVLSVVMLLAGFVCLAIAMRRDVEPMGGLLHPSPSTRSPSPRAPSR